MGLRANSCAVQCPRGDHAVRARIAPRPVNADRVSVTDRKKVLASRAVLNTIGPVQNAGAMEAGARTPVRRAQGGRMAALVDTLIGVFGSDRPAPVQYTRGLVAYVGSVSAVAVAAGVLTVRRPSDGTGLAVVTIVMFFMSVCSVRPVTGHDHVFTPTFFLGLGLTLTLGPVGCAATAVAEALGWAVRFRSGLFRFSFNVTQMFLSVLAAWAVYEVITRSGISGVLWLGLAGLTAGCVLNAVNYG